jgi:enterochelin esterase-like enzyme
VSLTGPLFLALVAVLAAVGFVGAVLLMPRIAGRRPAASAARAGGLLLVNLLVVLLAAVAMNDQFTFFADWVDLWGAMRGSPQVHTVSTAHAGADAAQAADAAVPGQPDAASSAGSHQPPPPGETARRTLRFTVTGERSGLRGTVLVTLPEDYASPAGAARRYPVLETFHGYPGDPSQWIRSMRLTRAIDQGTRQGAVGDMLVVAPALEFPPGVDTECVDGAGTAAKVETWLTQDVPNWVTRTFRARADRSSWAAIGLSMGAWCAAMATMLHPDRYAVGIVMGGYFTPQFPGGRFPGAQSRGSGRPSPADAQRAHRYDLVALARDAPPPVALWVETSRGDEISAPTTYPLLAAAHPPLSVQAVVLAHAGHRLSLWSAQLPTALAWLGRGAPGFAPGRR